MAELSDPSQIRQLMSLDPQGLADLIAHVPTDRTVALDSPVGSVVSVEGRKLHSTRNPLREARRFVRRQDLGESSVVVLMGLGSGHVARAVMRQTGALLVIFEPDLDVLAMGLEHGPLPAQQVQIVTQAKRLGAALYRVLKSGDKGRILSWTPSVRQHPKEYAEAIRETGLAIERARTRDLTTQVRVQGWLDFYLTNIPRLTEGPSLDALTGCLKGVPAVLCSAGPSLTKNLKLLRGLENEVFILVVNTAARAVAKLGVKPHALISVESLDVSEHFKDLPWLQEVPTFLEMTGNPRLFEIPTQSILPLSVETSACAQFTRKATEGPGVTAGFCVANAASSVLQQLGCNPIILAGQDLAYSGNRVYATGTVFEDIRADLGTTGTASLESVQAKLDIEARSKGTLRSGIRAATTFKTDTVPCWGSDGTVSQEFPEVTTTREFLLFRDWFASAGSEFSRAGVTLLNATEGGAHIPNWDDIPLAKAIERHIADNPLGPSRDVRGRFQASVRDASITSPSTILKAVEAERHAIAELLTLGIEARRLVNDDPDGDILADPAVAIRLAEIYRAVIKLYSDAPLVREAMTSPLDVLSDRQELNTLSMHLAMRQHLTELDNRLGLVETTLRERRDSAAA